MLVTRFSPNTPRAPVWLTARQKASSLARAPSEPPSSRPAVKATAFMAPAEAAVIDWTSRPPYSIRRSSTPHWKAPCAPPPCRARLMGLAELTAADRRRNLTSFRRPAAIDLQARAVHRGPGVGRQIDQQPGDLVE